MAWMRRPSVSPKPMPEIFGQDLGRNVFDVFPAIVHDRLGDAFHTNRDRNRRGSRSRRDAANSSEALEAR